MGSRSKALSFLIFSLSFRRSVLHPIKIMGTSRQKWWTSGYHCRGTGRNRLKQNFFFYINTFSGLPLCCNGVLYLYLGHEGTVPLLGLYLNRVWHIPLNWHDWKLPEILFVFRGGPLQVKVYQLTVNKVKTDFHLMNTTVSFSTEGNHLYRDIVKRRRIGHIVADDNKVHSLIWQRPQAIIVLLACQ